MNAQTRSKAGYAEPTIDYFTDVRRACSEFLYRSCDQYRRSVEYSRARAIRQQSKRREGKP